MMETDEGNNMAHAPQPLTERDSKESCPAGVASPVSFQRIYSDGYGPVYPATPIIVATVIRSMNEHATGWDAFKVRFVMPDGAKIVVGPKRRKRPVSDGLASAHAAERMKRGA